MKQRVTVFLLWLALGSAAIIACTEPYTPGPPVEYDITPSGANSAAITVTVGGLAAVKAQAGKTVTVTANPPANHAVNYFTVTRTDSSTPISPLGTLSDPNARTFTMPSGHVLVEVEFVDITNKHTLTITQIPVDGTLNPSLSGQEFSAGQRIEFTVTPPVLHTFESITLNGGSSGITVTSGNVQFFMPNGAATVTITYTELNVKDWEEIIGAMYPGALVLQKNPSWGENTSVPLPNGISSIVDNVVKFSGELTYNPYIQFTVGPAVDLNGYEALLVLCTLSELTHPLYNEDTINQADIQLDLRDGKWGADNKVSFYPSEGSGFPNIGDGMFFLGKSGAAYAAFAACNAGAAPANGRGFNIQNIVTGGKRQTGFTMTVEAVMLLPKCDTGGYGAKGNEFILDPTLLTRSRTAQPSESAPVYDWVVLSADYHARYDLPSVITNAVTDGYTKLVVDFSFLYSNRVPPHPNTAAAQYLALQKSDIDHGRTTANEIARSPAINRTQFAEQQVEIALSGVNGSVTNRLEFVCMDVGRILFKINSMKLVK